jgi:hypothetical protein
MVNLVCDETTVLAPQYRESPCLWIALLATVHFPEPVDELVEPEGWNKLSTAATVSTVVTNTPPTVHFVCGGVCNAPPPWLLRSPTSARSGKFNSNISIYDIYINGLDFFKRLAILELKTGELVMNLLAERIANKLWEDHDADEWEVATHLAPRVSTQGIELLLREANHINRAKLANKFDVVEWMAERGKTSYKTQIEQLKAAGSIFLNDGDEVPPALEAKIEEIRQMAQDRYDDWASD